MILSVQAQREGDESVVVLRLWGLNRLPQPARFQVGLAITQVVENGGGKLIFHIVEMHDLPIHILVADNPGRRGLHQNRIDPYLAFCWIEVAASYYPSSTEEM